VALEVVEDALVVEEVLGVVEDLEATAEEVLEDLTALIVLVLIMVVHIMVMILIILVQEDVIMAIMGIIVLIYLEMLVHL